MRYDGMIFDQDGMLATLTDEPLIRQAVEETFEHFDAPSG